jgi:aminoglycoside 6'-N-acetyltransferase
MTPFAPEPLHGAVVHLVPAGQEHLDAFTALLSDPTVTRWWPNADPRAEAQEQIDPEPDRVVWAIEFGGAVVGLVQGWEETEPDYRHAGIDIAIASAAQGRGIGPDAIRTVARWLIDVRGHHRITIDPATANERAIRAYRKVGFRTVGVLRDYERGADGTWHDGLLLDLLAGELVDG